jgi:predicted DNA-binding transcriptional regulator AlpA
MQNTPTARQAADSAVATATAKIPAALAGFDELPASAYVDIDVVAGVLSCGRSTIWTWVKSQRMPAPRKFGRSTRWNVGALRAMLAEGLQEADHAKA